MFGIRPSSLFRSRWLALGWAVMICLSAVGFVASRDDSDDSAAMPDEVAVNVALDALN